MTRVKRLTDAPLRFQIATGTINGLEDANGKEPFDKDWQLGVCILPRDFVLAATIKNSDGD